MLKNTTNEDKYINILGSDATFRLVVSEDTEGAVRRDWTSKDGSQSGTKYELIYNEISGVISDIKFYDGKFGKNILLTFTDNSSEPLVLSIGTATPFGEDVMKKLPNINIKQEVTLKPYKEFTSNEGKKIRAGVTVYQNGIKIENFYYDKETGKNLYGFPNVVLKKGKVMSSDDWKLYFLNCRVFLIDDITKRFIDGENEIGDQLQEQEDALA